MKINKNIKITSLTSTLFSFSVSPIYDPYAGECLLERTLVPGHRHCELGWPVPFLAPLISLVFTLGLNLVLGVQ